MNFHSGVIDQNNPELACPYDLNVIETYLQVLQPAYSLSIGMQSNANSIADILVAIKGCIWLWEHMNVNVDARNFTDLLIQCTKSKFEFELNSPIYKVFNNAFQKYKYNF